MTPGRDFLPPVVIGSVLERDGGATRARLAALPPACAVAEIRADHLGASELREAVAAAGRPVVVTVRRTEDGGAFEGSEEERGALVEVALEAGADLVDVEWDTPLASRLASEHPDRVIVSHHGAPCTRDAVESLYRDLARTPARRLKIVPAARRIGELAVVRDVLRRAGEDGRMLACFALGRAGRASRVLAPSWGSWATYGAAVRGTETGAGQFTVEELLELYRVREIGESTRRFALIGRRVSRSPSPAMHHAAYRDIGLDACYLPVELDELDEIESALGAGGVLGLEGLAVTIPFKEAAAARCVPGDAVAEASRAVNTVRVEADGTWHGFNTDGPAARSLIEERGMAPDVRVAVVGAGGTAAAVAAALAGGGAIVTLFNRSRERASALAARLEVTAEPLEALTSARWDVLVNATPLGTEGEEVVAGVHLCGRLVLDAVYAPRATPLIAEARRRGLATVDGLELLTAQAAEQLRILTGHEPPVEVMRSAGRRWLRSTVPPASA